MEVRKMKGANMDIDFSPADWAQDKCPWGPKHRCAVKGVSICKFFNGIEVLDNVLCSYPVPRKKK
ncbi:MAG: hypothetical protein V1887_03670 [Candidatus Aenigmatarchaeota archaeon]